jgi:hypothetical protein
MYKCITNSVRLCMRWGVLFITMRSTFHNLKHTRYRSIQMFAFRVCEQLVSRPKLYRSRHSVQSPRFRVCVHVRLLAFQTDSSLAIVLWVRDSPCYCITTNHNGACNQPTSALLLQCVVIDTNNIPVTLCYTIGIGIGCLMNRIRYHRLLLFNR